MSKQRVVVVGQSCAGLTTFATTVATGLGVSTPMDPARREAARGVSTPSLDATGHWVAEGGCREHGDDLWSHATIVVWLALPFWTRVWRAVWRVVKSGSCMLNAWHSLWAWFTTEWTINNPTIKQIQWMWPSDMYLPKHHWTAAAKLDKIHPTSSDRFAWGCTQVLPNKCIYIKAETPGEINAAVELLSNPNALYAFQTRIREGYGYLFNGNCPPK